MSSDAGATMNSDAQERPTTAGSSTDQEITGPPETGTFTTDEAPAGDTPAHGSSNAGVNKTRANRHPVDGAPEGVADH